MSNIFGKRGGQDRTRINVKELDEWAKKLNVTKEQLKDAMYAVGNRAADVERRLRGVDGTTNSELPIAKGDSQSAAPRG